MACNAPYQNCFAHGNGLPQWQCGRLPTKAEHVYAMQIPPNENEHVHRVAQSTIKLHHEHVLIGSLFGCRI